MPADGRWDLTRRLNGLFNSEILQVLSRMAQEVQKRISVYTWPTVPPDFTK